METPASPHAAPDGDLEVPRDPRSCAPGGEKPSAMRLVWPISALWLLVVLPFVAVTFPPVTDLPQQVAQVRLLGEAFSGDSYRVNWLHPNKLSYLALGLGFIVSSPLVAGRVAMTVLALAWVVALALLARDVGRGTGAVALAVVFFFSHAMYWGLLSFLSGLPVFVVWWIWTGRLARDRLLPRDGAVLLALAVLLWFSHALWLAVGLLWLLLDALLSRLSWRGTVSRLAWLSPMLLGAAIWYPTLGRAGFDSVTVWGLGTRLRWSWFPDSLLGGVRGPLEPAVLLVVLAWVALGVVQARRDRRWGIDVRLGVAAGMFLVLALALPQVHQGTVYFASRWLVVAATLIVLAVPQPRVGRALRFALPFFLLAGFTVGLSSIWLGWENQELSGLEASLTKLPRQTDATRVLGLDMVRESPRIKGFPFYHLYAYSQVLTGATLNESFARFPSSLVVWRDLPHEDPWSADLDWRPRGLRRSDLPFFDFVIIHAAPGEHQRFAADPLLSPVPGQAADVAWRLYAVTSEG